jgi:hypothetical protein
MRTRLLQWLGKAWDRLWFSEIPPHTYAVLRVSFGILGILELLGATPVSMFWDPNGLSPLPGGGFGLRAWIIGAGLGTIVGWGLFASSMAAFICVLVGLGSQVAVIAAFLCTLLQLHWNPLPLSSAHQVLTVVLFALIWADCSQVLTIAGRRLERGAPQNQPVWPLRLLQFQVCVIYLNSGLWKLYGPTWRDGSALHYSLSLNLFHRFPIEIPASLGILLVIGTYVTLFWEIAFTPLVLWRPTRALALMLGVALHLGVWATLEVGPFSWMMIATYVAFLDPERVARTVDGWRTPARRFAPGGPLPR